MKPHRLTSRRNCFLTASILVLGAAALTLSSADAGPTVSWLMQYGTSATGGDFGQGIAVDAAGQSWVAGLTAGNLGGTGYAGGDADMFLSRISSTGTLDFTQQRGTNTGDASRGVTLLGSGTVFTGGITGSTLDGQTNAGGNDAAILQYNTSGAWQGTRLFGTSGTEFIGDVTANGTNLFATGHTQGSLGGEPNAGNSDAFLTKHDNTGALIWTRLVGSSADETGYDVALDTTGNAFIGGFTTGNLPGFTNAGGYDLFLAKFDANGNRTLLKQFGTSAVDFASGIKVDVSGNIYLVGYTFGNLDGQTNAGSDDAFVTKLDSAGNVLWTRLFGGSSFEMANAVDVDSNGNVLLTRRLNKA